MDWADMIWLIAGVSIGFFVGFKIGIKFLIPHTKELARLISYHRSGYLKILQREMANVLIRKDPQRFLETYKKAHEEFDSIKSSDPQVLKAKLLLLTEKYQQYEDFDLIGTRDYVLYADALSGHPLDEIEGRYSDILMFQALQSELEKDWPSFANTSEKEVEHLKEYVRNVIDTQFKQKLKNAISEFYSLRQKQPDLHSLDTTEFFIKYVHDFAENRYGIHLKSSNEFGLYSFFVFDDGKIHESYYRSDENFQKTEILRDILINDPV